MFVPVDCVQTHSPSCLVSVRRLDGDLHLFLRRSGIEAAFQHDNSGPIKIRNTVDRILDHAGPAQSASIRASVATFFHRARSLLTIAASYTGELVHTERPCMASAALTSSEFINSTNRDSGGRSHLQVCAQAPARRTTHRCRPCFATGAKTAKASNCMFL